MLGSFFSAACNGKSVNSEPKNQNFHTITLQTLSKTNLLYFQNKNVSRQSYFDLKILVLNYEKFSTKPNQILFSLTL